MLGAVEDGAVVKVEGDAGAKVGALLAGGGASQVGSGQERHGHGHQQVAGGQIQHVGPEVVDVDLVRLVLVLV